MSKGIVSYGSSVATRRQRPLVKALLLGMAVSPLAAAIVHADATWTGATNQDWNTVSNWSADPNGQNVIVNTSTGNYPIVTADQTFTPIDILVGVGPGTSGRVDQRAGTITTGTAGNWMFLGNNGGTGVYNLADTSTTGTGISGYGTGSGSLTVAGNFYIGGRYFGETGGASGTLNINTTGTITAGLFDVYDNNNEPGTGVVNLENGTITSNGELWVGAWGTGTGTLNQTGGTVNTAAWMAIGRGNHDGGTGTYNISGGTINAAQTNASSFITLGSFAGSNGVMNVSGTATVNSAHAFYIGEGGTGTVNITGGTINAVGNMIVGVNGGSNGTLNLNGGTVQVNSLTKGAGTGVVNFNGGVVKAQADNANFMTGVTANVQGGGVKIDTNGKTVTAGQVFSHDATGPAVDGGLTKQGTGALVLSGASTYTGTTTISGGTLRLASGGAPQAVARYTFDALSGGSLAGGTVVANSGTGGVALNGTVNHADNALDPVNGGLSVTAGHSGNGVAYDGLGSSIDVASKIVDQSGSTSWTFSAWINTTSNGSSILSKDDGNNQWNQSDSTFYLGTNPISGTPGTLPTAVRNSGGFVQGDPTPTSLTDGTWHMVTFVDNAGTKTIYVDGVATTMTYTDFNLGDTSTISRIGYNLDTLTTVDGATNFAGTLDDVQFYDTALNAAQVGQVFTGGVVTTGVGSQQYLPVATPVNITASGATLDLNSNNQQIGSLAGVAGSAVTLGTGTLSIGTTTGSTTFAGVISGTGGVTKTGASTQILTGANTYTGVTTVSGGVLRLGTAAQGVVMGNATITSPAGADIKGGKLVLDYSGTSPASQVQSILAAGYAQPVKFQSGKLRSTTLAANRTLGWRDTGSTVEVAYTLAGDADLSFSVDFGDLLALAKNYNGTGKVWSQGDFNYDAAVGFDDLLALAKNYNGTVTAAQASQLNASFVTDFALAQSMVPEPATLGAIIGLGGLVTRRRRK